MALSSADFIQRFYQLTPRPKAVLIAFLKGYQDTAIAEELGLSIAAVRKHIQNLCDHFEIEREGDWGKQSRRKTLAALGQNSLQQWLTDRSPMTDLPPPQSVSLTDVETEESDSQKMIASGNIPQGGMVIGRETELKTLAAWVDDPDLRLGVVTGLSGSGKTHLVAQALQGENLSFDSLYWSTLQFGESLWQWLDNCLLGLNPAVSFPALQTLEQPFDVLLQQLTQRRCLLIIDNWQVTLSTGQLAGYYAPAQQGFRELLSRLLQSRHQSLVIIISSIVPQGVRQWLRPGVPCQQLTLGGLPPAAWESFGQSLGLLPSSGIEQLACHCGDRPLSGLQIAPIIRQLFGGNVQAYLAFNPLGITEEMQTWAQGQLTSLTSPERDIVEILAFTEAPLSLGQLQAQVALQPVGLLSTLTSLVDRHLVSLIKEKFVLETVIARSELSQQVNRLWADLRQLNTDEFLPLESGWYQRPLARLFIDTEQHPLFQHLWQSHHQQTSQILEQLQNSTIPASPPEKYLVENWQALWSWFQRHQDSKSSDGKDSKYTHEKGSPSHL